MICHELHMNLLVIESTKSAANFDFIKFKDEKTGEEIIEIRMPYFKNGNLFDLIRYTNKNKIKLSLDLTLFLFSQIVLAVKFLH